MKGLGEAALFRATLLAPFVPCAKLDSKWFSAGTFCAMCCTGFKMDIKGTFPQQKRGGRGGDFPNETLIPYVSLTGDYYFTRHSNLSKVHAVFHLVTDESAIMSSALRSRHLVMVGLKNCLYTATRHDFYTITVPLFLVHTMQPVSVSCVCICGSRR